MDKKSLDKNSSIEWLKSGKILIHPTESIWGFGCDAFNESAVNKIFEIKKRDKQKNLILLSNSIESIEKELCFLSNDDKKFLSKYWPGPYTFLIKYNKVLLFVSFFYFKYLIYCIFIESIAPKTPNRFGWMY